MRPDGGASPEELLAKGLHHPEALEEPSPREHDVGNDVHLLGGELEGALVDDVREGRLQRLALDHVRGGGEVRDQDEASPADLDLGALVHLPRPGPRRHRVDAHWQVRDLEGGPLEVHIDRPRQVAQQQDAVDVLAGLVGVRRPAVDGASPAAEEEAPAVQAVRQAHGEALDERDGAGHVHRLLVVPEEPPLPLRVELLQWEVPVVAVQGGVPSHAPVQAAVSRQGESRRPYHHRAVPRHVVRVERRGGVEGPLVDEGGRVDPAAQHARPAPAEVRARRALAPDELGCRRAFAQETHHPGAVEGRARVCRGRGSGAPVVLRGVGGARARRAAGCRGDTEGAVREADGRGGGVAVQEVVRLRRQAAVAALRQEKVVPGVGAAQ